MVGLFWKRGCLMQSWKPQVVPTRREALILKRLKRHRRLFAFLRYRRHELLDESFQTELVAMYRDSGAGVVPLNPAMMCLVVILQAYVQASDAEAVELSVMDARWQMVLDCLGSEKPPFSQGALQGFRERLIASDMDRRLLERTVALAKETREFGWKSLPKSLRLAVDSRPLQGAGRVEDTVNLLGHAARKIAEGAAFLLSMDYESVCHAAGIPVLVSGSSVKAALDIDWNDAEQKRAGLRTLNGQIESLVSWVNRRVGEGEIPEVAVARQIQAQDLEATHDDVVLREGVAPDRRISIEDEEMRHGRKSKTKRFDGYKEHVASDLDSRLIVACAVTPANIPEGEAAESLVQDLAQQPVTIRELHIDRAYITSELADHAEAGGVEILCKPWRGSAASKQKFSKSDFKINLRDQTITCPGGVTESFELGGTVAFSPEDCGPCPLRAWCTHSATGRGRSIHIAEDEKRQKELRKLQASVRGRERLRQRTGVEHRLAHIANRKGRRARYLGTRKNLFDLRRTAALQNLETIQCKQQGPAKMAA